MIFSPLRVAPPRAFVRKSAEQPGGDEKGANLMIRSFFSGIVYQMVSVSDRLRPHLLYSAERAMTRKATGMSARIASWQ